MLWYPYLKNYPNELKSVLYKIRWRNKRSFREVQKIFENISTSFLISYTSQIVKKKYLTPSSFINPILN
jgi:hypothetical protein